MDNITKRSPLDKIVIIRNCKNLNSTQKSLLFSIASRLGKNNFCYPSFTTLMIDSGIKNRTSLVENLTILENLKIIWIISPKDGYKSNRYGIDFDLLVRVAYQCSTLGALGQCATRTRLVRKAYPKGNTNKKLNKNKKDLSVKEEAEEAKTQMREFIKKRKKSVK